MLLLVVMSDNFHTHDRGRDHVHGLLSRNWIVSVIMHGKDDYLKIHKPHSEKSYTIKVKALSKIAPVPFHTRSPDSINADFLTICRNLESGKPEIFTATMDEVKKAIHEKDGEFWLETKDYEKFQRDFQKIEREYLEF